jgi:hypothetical protein
LVSHAAARPCPGTAHPSICHRESNVNTPQARAQAFTQRAGDSDREFFREEMMPIRMELQALRASCVGRDEMQSLRRELHEVMAGTEVIASNYASRADVSQVQVQLHQMETTILKWFVVTAIAMSGLVFTGARLLH